MAKPLKLLHTSDWHLGRRLYGHTRYQEFTAFLDWLYHCIVEQEVDVLIVAGDIFDTMTPSNRAQSLYYEFLGRISSSSCQHVIIVAGNHDSPSLLDAPKEVLKFLDVHIIGTACDTIEKEVITLTDKNDQPQAIILAVPYLRDKDVRHSQSGESSTDKQTQLVAGIASHYAKATEIAKQRQSELLQSICKTDNNKTASKTSLAEKKPPLLPIIATGHLMAIGGKTTSDDGVRELYIGNLGGISATIFDPIIDYVALGHLHVPQLVGGNPHIRYCGSPIPMGFGEANQKKQVLLVEFSAPTQSSSQKKEYTPSLWAELEEKENVIITPIKIPTFHRLAQIKGDLNHIKKHIDDLKAGNEPVWLEVIYQSEETISNLSTQLTEFVKDSQIEIIKIKNDSIYQRVLKQTGQSESLHDLTHQQVFERCLNTHNVKTDKRVELMACFQQVIYEINHEDIKAE